MSIPRTKKQKLVGYGVLLFVVTNALLFLLSIAAQFEQPMGIPWVWPIVAVMLAFCSFWFSRILKPSTTKESFTYGLVWAVLLAVFLLLVTIPNQTTTIVFGSWNAYLIFIGVALGPLFVKPKNGGNEPSQKNH